MDIIECERAQLRIELTNDPHSPENCYIEQAICELAKREEELLQKVFLLFKLFSFIFVIRCRLNENV